MKQMTNQQRLASRHQALMGLIDRTVGSPCSADQRTEPNTDIGFAVAGFGSTSPATRSQSDAASMPPLDALSAFIVQLQQVRHPPSRIPSWWRRRAFRRFGGRCAYCLVDVSDYGALFAEALIPFSLGGPHHVDAVVLCCRRCKRAKGARDVLLWKPECSDALLTLRTTLALEAWNHPVQTSRAHSKAKTASVLADRWIYPRFKCHAMLLATGGLIGWRNDQRVPVEMPLMLAMLCGGQRQTVLVTDGPRRGKTEVVYWIAGGQKAIGAVETLIEHNALVQRFEIEDR
jgi:hypothetical protein